MTCAEALDTPPPLAELCAAGPVTLFLDFDGTLVEIAQTPDGISVSDNLVSGLEALSARLSGRLALVSGRSLEDLARHLGDGLRVAKAGSHGAARELADGSALGDLPHGLPQIVIEQLDQFAEQNDLRYEAKTHGGALHSRENPEKGEAALTFAKSLAEQHQLAIKTGKCVVELVHKGADKGSAVQAFMQESPFAGSSPIFLGDDVTDEDGFAASVELGGFGILIGHKRETRASFALASVSETHQWLGL